MRDEPVTVLMPARNAEATIARAITSTATSLPPGSRILVHDDASTDGTADVIERLGLDRVRLVHSPEGRGVAGGLNHLLEMVDTPLVARMDADDISAPWRFRLSIPALTTHQAMFTTIARFGSSVTGVRLHPPVPISADAFPLSLLIGNPVDHPTLLARTDSLRAVGGYRALPAEDYDLWLRMASSGTRIVRSGFVGLFRREHPAQVTANSDWRREARERPGFEDAYTDLSRRVLDTEPVWFRTLRRLEPTDTAQADAHLDQFAALITERSASLPGLQRRAVNRRLAKKLHQLRTHRIER